MRKHRVLPFLFAPLLLVCVVLPTMAQSPFVISDFENKTTTDNVGYSSPWVFTTDADSHGNSVILSGDTMTVPTSVDSNSFAPGNGASKSSFKVQYKYGNIRPHGDAPDTSSYDPEIGIETDLASDTAASADFTGATQITFWAKADKATNAQFIVVTPEIKDFSYYRQDIAVTTAWKQFTVVLKASATFLQPDWSADKQPFDIAQVKALIFSINQAFNPGPGGTFYLDDVAIYGYTPPGDPTSLRSARKSDLHGRVARLESDRSFRLQLPEAFQRSGGRVQVFGLDGIGFGQSGFAPGDREVHVPLDRDVKDRVFYRILPR